MRTVPVRLLIIQCLAERFQSIRDDLFVRSLLTSYFLASFLLELELASSSCYWE